MKYLFLTLPLLFFTCKMTNHTASLIQPKNNHSYLEYNWNIQDEDIPKDQKVNWEKGLNAVHKYFISSFNFKKEKLNIDIVYFTNIKSFKNYQLDTLKRKRATKSGFYSSFTKKLYMINENNSSPIAKNIFTHEATHRIFNSEIKGNAIILNEGLATLFQTIHLKNNDYYLGVNTRHDNNLKEIISNNELYDLSDFFKLSNKEWQKNNRICYAQSNALMYFMLSNHPKLLQLILNEYKKPIYERKDYIELIENNYVNGLSQFEIDWKKWISKTDKPEIKI